MKFDLLLAQYLYQHKILHLPGIGTFEAEGSVSVPSDNDRQKPSMDGISFRSASVTKADDELIEFIKVHTGKMKPLAISDLESYLTLGKQFLYIGKPFYMEGIGTLKLTKEGRFEFTPGGYVTTKLDDPNVERSEGKKRSVHEENRIEQESTNNNIKKVLLAVVVLGGIALVGWGSYYLYNKYADQQNHSVMVESANMLPDSTATQQEMQPAVAENNNGTAPAAMAAASIPGAGTYKFVVETTQNKLRAMNRYGVLKAYGNKIQLSTKDSVTYKLFYALRAAAADTAHIRDSLNRWYYGNTKSIRVVIEP